MSGPTTSSRIVRTTAGNPHEFARECIAIRVERKLKAVDVIDVLSDLFILRGIPTHIRSDNVLSAEENGLGRQSFSARQHAHAA